MILITVLGCAVSSTQSSSDGTYSGGYSDGTGWGTSSSGSDADTDVDSDSDTDADTDTSAGSTGDTGTPCGPDETVAYWISPDDSNSMASAEMARDWVLAGNSPSGVPIRPWEFLNYYSFDYEAAAPDTVALDVQLAQDPDLPAGEYRLQIGLTSEHREAMARQPMNLALSLDTSCSMTGTGIARSADACHAIAASLVDGDLVSVVTWAQGQNTLLSGWEVTGPSDAVVDGICDDLVADGSTDLHTGLVTAYDLVEKHYDPTRINRVVLVSDGGANVGVTDAELIGDEAGALDEDGVYLVGVGVGDLAAYNDHLMDQVTDLGRGAAVYLGSSDEAWAMLHDRFEEVMDVAARNVQVRVDLPPGFEFVKLSAEAVSTQQSEIPPQHLAPNDSMAFFQHVATCAPDDVTADTPLTVAVTYQDALTFLPVEVERTWTFGELLGGSVHQLRRGAALYAYSQALKLQTPEATIEALARLADADLEYPGDAELAEIRSVLAAL